MHKIHTLDNGLKVVTSNMSGMESAAIGILIGMGGRYEDQKYCGVSHFLEHMLFKGTIKRDAKELKEAIEGVGGHFNGFTAEEVTCYLVKVPSKYMALGLDVLCDMILNPKINEVDLEKERQVILEEIKMYKDQPSSYVYELLAETMWPDHPLGRPLTGFDNTVRATDRKTMFAIKNHYYVPNNIAIVAAGKVDEEKLIKSIEKSFSGKEREEINSFDFFKNEQNKKRIKVYFKDTEQTQIAIGFHSFGRGDKRRYALNILNIILGGNMSSRLFEELREKKGFCYDISSSVKKYEETGAFTFHAGVDNMKVKSAVKAIMKELSLIKDELVSGDELKRAKEFYKGQLLLALEDTGSRMIWLGDRVMTKQGIPAISKVLKGIEAVTKKDVMEVALEILNTKKMSLACIGPERTLKKINFGRLLGV